MSKRTPGQHTGHYTGRFVDWVLVHWLQFVWLAVASYGLYSVHIFVQRFLDFTTYVFATVESHKAIETPEAEQPNTTD